jgi:hypothetical protein
MRYGALVTYSDISDFASHRILTDEQRKIPYRLPDEALYAMALYIYSLEPPANANKMDERASAGQKVFTSAGCGWCTQQPARFHDGPWLHKLSDGTLISFFSQQSAQGYAIGLVESSNGRLDGTWTHHPELLVTGGGHGMLFTSLNGKLMLATHKDVAQRVTNPFFYEMEEDLANKTLRIVKPRGGDVTVGTSR